MLTPSFLQVVVEMVVGRAMRAMKAAVVEKAAVADKAELGGGCRFCA